jgi:hypothetical protein
MFTSYYPLYCTVNLYTLIVPIRVKDKVKGRYFCFKTAIMQILCREVVCSD